MDRLGKGTFVCQAVILMWTCWQDAPVSVELLPTNQPAAEPKDDSATFVLVHGLLHGAWCWYKVVAILKEKGYNVTALDLTSLGISKTSPDTVSTMAELTRPVADYLSSATGKFILVGHSSGGFAISYLMELFSDRVEKAVYLASSMPINGDSFTLLDPGPFTMGKLLYHYGDGPDELPTSFFLKSPVEFAVPTFYNESPSEDIDLALSSLVPQPLKPFREALSLSLERYGRVRRFFIKALHDPSLPGQEASIERNPPERVFELASDHSAFFSQPEKLAAILAEVESS